MEIWPDNSYIAVQLWDGRRNIAMCEHYKQFGMILLTISIPLCCSPAFRGNFCDSS